MGAGPHAHFSLLRRVIASLCAVLIFVLGLCAASPALHQHLHAGAGGTSDDGCVVALFATGVSVPYAAVAVAPPPTRWCELPRTVTDEVFLDSPRYLLQPERGPPIA